MSLINRFKKELFLKIVYVGPARSGKSENLRRIFESTQSREPSGFLAHTEQPEPTEPRSLFFDFLPLSLGTVADFNVRLHLFSVPGSGKYDAVTRMILRGIDGIVFVVPSLPDRIEDTRLTLAATKELLKAFGKSWGDVPVVVQYTFRDSPRALPIESLRELFNPEGFPEAPAEVTKFKGVLETLKTVSHAALHAFKMGGSSVDGHAPTQ